MDLLFTKSSTASSLALILSQSLRGPTNHLLSSLFPKGVELC
jgi:hypothetical protein